MDHLYKQAIDVWGKAAQIGMAMEECNELAAQLHRVFFRGRGKPADVASEIADVEIMCAQLRLIVGNELVDLEKLGKIARLQQRLAKHQ